MAVTTARLRDLLVTSQPLGLIGTNSEIRANIVEKRYPQADPLGSAINTIADQLQAANPTWNEGRCLKTAMAQLTALISLVEVRFGVGETVTAAEVGLAMDTITDLTFERTVQSAFSTVLAEMKNSKFANASAVRQRLAALGV